MNFSNQCPKGTDSDSKVKGFLGYQCIQYIENLKISLFTKIPSTLGSLRHWLEKLLFYRQNLDVLCTNYIALFRF